MMKAHGIHQSQTSTVENIRNSTVPTRGKKAPAAGPSRGRKRKADQGMESNLNEDDEEDFADVKPKVSRKKVKTEAHVNKLDNWLVKEDVVDEQAATEFVKEEPAMEEDTGTFMIENAYGKVRNDFVDAQKLTLGFEAQSFLLGSLVKVSVLMLTHCLL